MCAYKHPPHNGSLVAGRRDGDGSSTATVCAYASPFATRSIVAVTRSSMVLATHDGAELRDGSVTLPPLAGALLR